MGNVGVLKCPVCGEMRGWGSTLYKHICFEHRLDPDEAYELVGQAIQSATRYEDDTIFD